MKVIIHAGSHKTGSSSIQNFFFSNAVDGAEYIGWEEANHSRLFALMFFEPVESYPLFVQEGLSREALLQMRNDWTKRVELQLTQSNSPIVIFSAEDICDAEPSAIERLRDFFSRFCEKIEVVIYLRPPGSYIQSGFQQVVKSIGWSTLELAPLWPGYRRKISTLDLIFRPENVHIIRYSSSDLHGGDVVKDFCFRLGVAASGIEKIRVNEAVSLQGIALLYFQRRFGVGLRKGFKGAVRANNEFIHALSGIGGPPFRFSRTILEPVFERFADDLIWIGQRSGLSLSDIDEFDDTGVSCEEDLLQAALSLQEEIDEILRKQMVAIPDHATERLALSLDLLQQIFILRRENRSTEKTVANQS